LLEEINEWLLSFLFESILVQQDREVALAMKDAPLMTHAFGH
jgi:hypothetical protein